MKRYDIAIIGAGPGGYVAGIRAARLGAKTTLIEAGEAGGVCLNRGCIPTKAISASVSRLRAAQNAKEMGIDIGGEIKADLPGIISRKNKVVSQLVKGLHQLIKTSKIDYINGFASFNSDRSVSVGDERIEAANIIIATGSVWRPLPGIEPDSNLIVTSDDMLNITQIPSRLAILGGGVIGCEFASIFNSLGSKVTIIEAMAEILPMEDSITSRFAARAFKKQGIEIITGTTVSSLVARGSSLGVEIKLSSDEKLSADKLLVSVGRKPSYGNLGIEKLGIVTKSGAIVTDGKMRTNAEGIYAIGDVNGKYMLAHVASEEGIVAVENIMGKDVSMDYSAIPRPVYTYPEICCAGATGRELAGRGIKFKTGRFSYGAVPKAVCDGATDGQVVIYSGEGDGKILGAQLIGEHATEIAAELTLAIRNGLTVADLAKTIHSHPTLSEIVKEAAEDCEGRAIHKVYRS